MADDNHQEMVSARRPSFFQIYSADLSATQLKIPVGFVKHLEGMTFGSVSLMGPSGEVWIVDLVQREDDMLFLDDGWPNFVKDHFVECGDLLVFRYDGQLGFTVQVFGTDSCEKEAAFHSKCSQDHRKFSEIVGMKRERDESSFHCVTKRMKDDFSSECNLECRGYSSSNDLKQCRSPGDYSMLSKLKASNGKSAPSLSESSSLLDLETETADQRRIGKEDDLKLHEKGQMSVFSEREKRVAQSFISCYPYFVRIMKRFNVNGSYTLNVPYQFSTAHLPNSKTEIVLRTIKGGCWTVNSVPTTRVHTSHTFCGGWMAFVRQNDIKTGDVCIFELVRKLELRVFILRVGKDSGDDQTGIIASNGVNNGSAAASKKSRKNSLKVHSLKLINKLETCDKKGSKKNQVAAFSSHARKYGNVKQETTFQSRKDADADGTGSRMILALDEKKAAKSFTSDFPNFVRIMRKFNISGSYTLKIPHQFSAAHLPNCKAEVVLRNLEGKCWTVNSLPDSKGRTVHTFCGGWMAFVRDNDVKMGDVCMFELVNECEMIVRISRVGCNVQEHQCGESASNELNLLVFSGSQLAS